MKAITMGLVFRVVVVTLGVTTLPGCMLLVQNQLLSRACETDADCEGTQSCLRNVCVDDERDPLGTSCEGMCGQELDGCFCDVQCLQNGDCCDDFALACGGSDDAAQCAGRCGEAAPAGCFCDADCVDNGDCCPDYEDVCAVSPTDGGTVDDAGADGGVIEDAGTTVEVDAGGPADAGVVRPVTTSFAVSDYVSIDETGAVVADWPTEGDPVYLRVGPPGGGRVVFNAPQAGRYRISVVANGELGAGVPPHVEFRVNNTVAFEHDVVATGFATYEGDVDLAAGNANLDVVFVNDVFVAPGDDRNLLLGAMTVEGPTTTTEADAGAVVDAGVVVDAGPAVDAGGPGGQVPIIVGAGWQGVTVLSIDEGQTWCETGIMVDGHDDLFRGIGVHDGLVVGAHAGRANNGAIVVTEDGWRWEALHQTNFDDTLPVNPSGQWYANAAYGNGTWVAGGGCGTVATSSNGRDWTSQGWQFDGCLHIRDIHFAEGVFVATVQHSVDVDGGSETQYHWFESATGADGTWTLRQENAGDRITHDGQAFIADDNEFHQARGVCVWANGWDTNARIYRSTNSDCSDGVEVGQPSHSITGFAFSTTDAANLAPELMPQTLRDCLYP